MCIQEEKDFGISLAGNVSTLALAAWEDDGGRWERGGGGGLRKKTERGWRGP